MRSRYCTDEAKVAQPLCDSRAFCYTVYIVHCMGMQLSLNLHRLLCICNDNDDDDDDARNGSETCPWNVYGIADWSFRGGLNCFYLRYSEPLRMGQYNHTHVIRNRRNLDAFWECYFSISTALLAFCLCFRTKKLISIDKIAERYRLKPRHRYTSSLPSSCRTMCLQAARKLLAYIVIILFYLP